MGMPSREPMYLICLVINLCIRSYPCVLPFICVSKSRYNEVWRKTFFSFFPLFPKKLIYRNFIQRIYTNKSFQYKEQINKT